MGAKMAAEQHIASVVECLQRIATAETEGEPCAQVLPCLSAMPVTVPPVPLRVWTPRTFDSSACVCVGHRPSATFAEIKKLRVNNDVLRSAGFVFPTDFHYRHDRALCPECWGSDFGHYLDDESIMGLGREWSVFCRACRWRVDGV